MAGSSFSVIKSSIEDDDEKPRVITPFPSPKLMDLPMFQGDHRESLYWGTYRPHVYLGIRARTPLSLIAGLMWLGVQDGKYVMRHLCQHSDELKTYSWTQHNGRDYGHQIIVDQALTLTTSFLKSKGVGSGFGGDWAVRVDSQTEESRLSDEIFETTHIFFYVADEGGNAINLGRGVTNIHESSVLALGSHADVGGWELHLKSEDDYEIHYCGFRTPHIVNLTDLVQENLGFQGGQYDRLHLSDTSDDSANILVFQISGRASFKADIAFVSKTDSDSAKVKERVTNITGTSLTGLLDAKQKEFDDKFRRCFNLSDKLDSESLTVGMAALSNLVGGIGYFYGQSKISLSENSKHKPGDKSLSYWPAELYTAVPSRPIFPRGFLWDEGFHQLLIWRWDIHICLDIIGHWLDLMNIDGWIPREQILGAEAISIIRGFVPEEFVFQYPSNGNPPTLFLVLRDIVYSMKRNKFTDIESKEIFTFLERSFVRLEAWFKWYNTTQSGKDANSYFWHGRDNATNCELNSQTLTSGFDDYPRASHPSDDERHVDLRCWILLTANCMHSISEVLMKENELGKEYGLIMKRLSDFELLNQIHLDNDSGAYFDFGNHTEKVRLKWQLVDGGKNSPSQELVREVLEQPVLQLVPHFGYVSLFPFIVKIIPPQSWILGKQLDFISDKTILWTDFGLRSLAKTSSLYMKYNTEHDAPYWRGSIWMNMNYLILSSLYHYSEEDGPYRERAKIIYNDLRNNLIRNVVKNYQETGYIWEQYDQENGSGKGAHPFTGWTTTVLLIMAEAYSEC